MKRLLGILFLALFLGPQLGEVLLLPEPFCDEARDCCTPVCDVSCAQCACCAARTTVPVAAVTAASFDRPTEQATIAATSSPSLPPPAEILHVPKTS